MDFSVGFHTQMVGLYIKDSLCAFHHIGKMSQNIFQILACFIRNISKHAESCHIDKIIFIKASHIHGKQMAVHDILRCFHHIPRDLEAACKIVCTSRRNITEWYIRTDFHQTGNHFIKSSVSAAAHNQIDLFSHALCHFFRILHPLGRMHHYFIAALDKNIDDVHQFVADLPFSGSRIEDKQHSSFHSTPHLFILSYSFPTINPLFHRHFPVCPFGLIIPRLLSFVISLISKILQKIHENTVIFSSDLCL